MNLQEIKDELKQMYPTMQGFIQHTLVAEMCSKWHEKQVKIHSIPAVSGSLPDPALKLAGKMAMAAETLINSKISTVSIAITMLEDALNEYNNEIFSRR